MPTITLQFMLYTERRPVQVFVQFHVSKCMPVYPSTNITVTLPQQESISFTHYTVSGHISRKGAQKI